MGEAPEAPKFKPKLFSVNSLQFKDEIEEVGTIIQFYLYYFDHRVNLMYSTSNCKTCEDCDYMNNILFQFCYFQLILTSDKFWFTINSDWWLKILHQN